MSDIEFNNLSFDMPKSQSNTIKVIGVGGGGSNAVNHMYTHDIKGVDFVICNTDAQALQNSPIPNKIQLGASLTSGLGAGANPEVGGKAAEESIEEIKNVLNTQTKMVFITAGMGGGTGTGAAPIIAKIAKELDILTVGIVTMPFQFEGRMRAKQAQKGVDDLRDNVDSLIVINNNKLREVYGNLGFKAGFSKADEVLSTAARGIAEVITHHYKQNIDLHDAKTVLSNSGTAIMGSAKESGANRALSAITKALDSPLLNDNKITGAKNVLLLIVSGADEVTLDEIGEVNDFIQQEAGFEANIIMGVGEDEELGDAIAVTVVATGFAADQQSQITNTEVKKVYHTLTNEQTAQYEFNQEESFAKPKTEISKPIVKEEPKKVVHQLIEEEEEIIEKPLNDLTPTTEAIKNIDVVFEELTLEDDILDVDEDDFVIEDITPDLFSQFEVKPDASTEKMNQVDVFDLPVNNAIEVQNEEAINVFELPVNGAVEVKEEEPVNVFDIPVFDAQVITLEEVIADINVFAEEVTNKKEEKKPVYFPLNEEKVAENVMDLPVFDAVEVSLEEEEKESTIKYALEDFDIKPTIQNSSNISMTTEKPITGEVAEEGIKFEVRDQVDVNNIEVKDSEEISPLNLTIAEVQKNSEKRKNMFKNYNHKFKNTNMSKNVVDEIEKEPAYLRQGVELEDKKDVNNISRTSIDVDEDNDIIIRKNNSFLHDNVD